jgi:hypothetical protein
MCKLIIFLILSGISVTTQGEPWPEQFKKNFIKSGVTSCIASARQKPVLRHMTESQLNKYCSCFMMRMANSIPFEEARRLDAGESMEYPYQKMQSAADYCYQMLMGK